MARTNRLLGQFGESIARRRLERLGYRILGQNVRLPEGEIDIVAVHRDALVICEVKTRRGNRFGSALEAIDHRKAERLCRLADRFREQHPDVPPDTRIDLIAIELDGTGRLLSVEVIEDAVQAF